ncbi:MAG: glutamate 5-kinase [Candidatus Taylorbacteria bacterium]|nr:glutamate 5-kinase [Candidatus Taylorbacteria bacterium]
MKKRIAVKIGSAVLGGSEGGDTQSVIAGLVEDVSTLMKRGFEVVIISSGAVNTGRSAKALTDPNFDVSTPTKYDKRLLREQILAAVGQPKLMALYIVEFQKHGIDCAQVLTTRTDFADRTRYLSLRYVTEGLLRHHIVPVFNENDVLSPEELDFSDNDQLALMTAAMILADRLVILTDVAGVYDKSPLEAGAVLISEITDVSAFLTNFEAGKHKGKGGIKSKLTTAEVVTSLGIPMNIASGAEKLALTRIIDGEKLGTSFPATSEKGDPVKSWLVTSAAGEGRQIVVSTYLADILRQGESPERKSPSILLAGIEEIRGEFEKRDVVEIVDDVGVVLGRGLSRDSSSSLRKKIPWYLALSDVERAKVRSADIIAVHANDLAFVRQP